MKMPNLASENHPGSGRLSMDAQSGVKGWLCTGEIPGKKARKRIIKKVLCIKRCFLVLIKFRKANLSNFTHYDIRINHSLRQ